MRVSIQGIEVVAGVIRPKRSSARGERSIVQAKRAATAASLRIFGADLLSRLGTLFGLVDFETEDEGFDARFVIRTNNKDVSRYLLSAEVRASIERTGAFVFEGAGSILSAQRDGVGEDEDDIVSALKAVAALAARDQALYQEWQRLARELGGVFAPRGKDHLFGQAIMVEEQGIQLTIEQTQYDWGHRLPSQIKTCIEVKAGTEGFSVSRSRGHLETLKGYLEIKQLQLPNEHLLFSTNPEQTLRRFTQDLIALFPADIHIIARKTALRAFLGFEPSYGELRRALNLIVGLVASSAGPYR